MGELKNYMDDGACAQAKAVLAYLQEVDGIEESWNTEYHKYNAEPSVARWENCREQGYIVSLLSNDYGRQLNITFFEHRNSDCICAMSWEQKSINALTIDTADFQGKYKDKYDTDFDVKYGEASKMAEWIQKQLVAFWVDSSPGNNNP